MFVVQPMVGKMILPSLGGSPAVWNTCMVFFQAVLLAGYAYAHGTTARLGVRRQAALHLGLLLLPLLALPVAVAADGGPPSDTHPVPWPLALLTLSVGLPFFLVSTSAPLLQKWFAGTGHPAARDPYFLYAASNLGSMLALLGYPILVEPYWPLAEQGVGWAWGYGALVVLTAFCALLLWRAPAAAAADAPADGPDGPPPGWGQTLRWLALALVPSSLMLSVTTYVTTDIASIPLLWVAPLAIYLLTFILVFARRPLLPHRLVVAVAPVAVVLLAAVILCRVTEPVWLLLPLHLLGLFVVALVCHGALAQERPPARYLTGFFLWMSLGGVLGGLFNALVAPQVFSGVAEYPLVLVAACLLLPRRDGAADAAARRRDLALPLAAGLLTAVLAWALAGHEPSPGQRGGGTEM